MQLLYPAQKLHIRLFDPAQLVYAFAFMLFGCSFVYLQVLVDIVHGGAVQFFQSDFWLRLLVDVAVEGALGPEGAFGQSVVLAIPGDDLNKLWFHNIRLSSVQLSL